MSRTTKINYFLLSLCFLFISKSGIAQENGKNEFVGTIIAKNYEHKIKRGTGYNKDGSKVIHSDDPMADPNNNIIVSLYPLSFNPELRPLKEAIITQKKQTFIPNVLPVTKGTTVYFLNEDEFFHNIYSLTPGSRFNIGRRPPGSPYPLKIKRTGPIKLSCDIHSHMSGTILSLETPYFRRVSSNGKVRFTNLPNGTYRVTVFHPYLRSREYELTLNGGERKELEISLSN